MRFVAYAVRKFLGNPSRITPDLGPRIEVLEGRRLLSTSLILTLAPPSPAPEVITLDRRSRSASRSMPRPVSRLPASWAGEEPWLYRIRRIGDREREKPPGGC